MHLRGILKVVLARFAQSLDMLCESRVKKSHRFCTKADGKIVAILGDGQDHGWSRFVREGEEFLFDTGSELGRN